MDDVDCAGCVGCVDVGCVGSADVGCVDVGCVGSADCASILVEPVGAESEVFAACADAIGVNVVSATTSSISALNEHCLFLVNCLSSHRDFVTDVCQNFKSRQPV